MIPPKLRFRPDRGFWFVKWGGRVHYLGRDKAEARRRYHQQIREWSEWREARDGRRFPPMSKANRVIDLAERFLETKEAEGGRQRRQFYENHLRRFINAFARVRGDSIRAADLAALKTDMIRGGYHPKTVAHDLSAVKSLFRWAAGMELIPAVSLDFVRADPLPPTVDKSLTLAQVREMMKRAPTHIEAWLRINYYALMRPSEVIRVVHGQGVWEEAWLFRCHGKSSGRSSEFRRIVFSDAALSWLGRCEPRWSRQDTYYQAVARACGPGGPHPLRHSAATHLSQLGVGRTEIDLLLGHLPSRVSRSYVRIDWRSLRQTVARLRL